MLISSKTFQSFITISLYFPFKVVSAFHTNINGSNTVTQVIHSELDA